MSFFKDARLYLLRSHIVSQCSKVSETIKNEVNELILQNQHFSNQGKTSEHSGQRHIDGYLCLANLEGSSIKQINKALVMMFIMCALLSTHFSLIF